MLFAFPPNEAADACKLLLQVGLESLAPAAAAAAAAAAAGLPELPGGTLRGGGIEPVMVRMSRTSSCIAATSGADLLAYTCKHAQHRANAGVTRW
jgi:hypothetical protein